VLKGHVLEALGQKHEAREQYALARAAIQETADSIGDEALGRDFLDRAIRRLPRSRPGSSERLVAKTHFDGLTEREREVAALIALGRSNREIAEALFLSVRTVAVHVTNILSKLDFRSRAQIAGWATAKGISPAVSRRGP
jgi:non-specific serine/threonine protein kinase